jgi:hypothetical protein
MSNKNEKNYIYILDHTFIKKYCGCSNAIHKTVKYDYLPIINTQKIDLQNFINSTFLIYLKNVKSTKSYKTGFYGYFTSENVLLNENKSSNNVNKIEYNNEIFDKMTKKYNLFMTENLLFVKYKNIIPFDKIVSFTKYKTICQTLTFEPNKTFIQQSCLNVSETNINNIITQIEDEQEKNKQKEKQEDEEKQEDLSNSIVMNIPIVWNPCKDIIEKMNNLKIKKKEIIFHYKNCKNCNITDNNRVELVFDKKNINLQIKDKENYDNINKIINCYQFVENYIEDKTIFKSLNLDENNINVIYYKCENELYNESCFVIY